MWRFMYLCLFILFFDNFVWEIEYVVCYKWWESILLFVIIYGCFYCICLKFVYFL